MLDSSRSDVRFTFGNLHLGNSLPLVHRHKPGGVFPPAAEINDKLVFVVT